MQIKVVHEFPRKFEVVHRISPSPRFDWNIGRPELKKKRRVQIMELNCTNEEKILITVNPITSTGKPVALDGPVVVTKQVGDGDVVIQPDGKSFYVISGEIPGDTSYLVEGDADLGSGVETIAENVILHVAGAKAKNFGLVANAPEPK